MLPLNVLKPWLKTWVIFGAFLVPFSTWAKEYRAKFLPGTLGGSGIEWVSSTDSLLGPVVLEKSIPGSPTAYYVILHGKSPKNHRLFYEGKPINFDRDRSFSLEIPVSSPEQVFTVRVVGPHGKVFNQKNRIIIPDWKEITTTQEQLPPQKLSITTGLGLTLVNYQQTAVPNLTESALTLKVSGQYLLHPRWEITGNAFYTALPLTTSVNDMSIRFFGANARVGYRIPVLKSYLLTLNAGGYYGTSFTSDPSFGYNNIFGPQLYPILSREFSQSRKAWVYFKYSPILKGSSFLTLNNAEIATGGGYSFLRLKNGSLLSATLDVALLKLNYTGGSVQSNTYTLGMSYGF